MIEYKGNTLFGSVKVGERGQIVIPKKARDKYNINPGDSLILFGDKHPVIKIVKEDLVRDFALKLLEGLDEND
jgi:AbrB family looped-hinge helix DNA binding protein